MLCDSHRFVEHVWATLWRNCIQIGLPTLTRRVWPSRFWEGQAAQCRQQLWISGLHQESLLYNSRRSCPKVLQMVQNVMIIRVLPVREFDQFRVTSRDRYGIPRQV